MCITIFTSCFDIPEFSKNKKNYTFFSNSIQYVNRFRNFKKNSAFLEMIAMVHFGHNYSIPNTN